MANSRVLVVLLGAFMVLTKADTILRLKRGKYVDQVSRVRKSNLLCILKVYWTSKKYVDKMMYNYDRKDLCPKKDLQSKIAFFKITYPTQVVLSHP